MRINLITLLLMIGLLQASASVVLGQVTLKESHVPLEKVLHNIEKQTGYVFLYTGKDVQNLTISVDVNNVPVTEALDKCLKDLPLSYKMVDKNILLKRKVSAPTVVKPVAPVKISGRVTDSLNKPLPGATVKNKNNNKAVLTNENGEFSLDGNAGDQIVVSFIGYNIYTFSMTDDMAVQNVVLYEAVSRLNEVVVSTGYQTVAKERATGSFVYVDNKLLNRSVGTNIIDRLDGVTSGLIFNKNTNGVTDNSSAITIRGRSTIFANPNPLIVIDNFPYNGDLSSINPNDVQSITVLKDAAAASIWGAFSGNGVIVITTKKGKFNQAPKVEINSNLTIGNKPDLRYAPQLSSTHYIDVEQYLFKQGFYDNALTSTSFPVVSPVVDILDKRRSGLISSSDSATAINRYKGQDTRDDVVKYLYRKAVNQQYNINISGGGNNNLYYFSSGFDKNLNNLNRNDFDRISLNGSNTYTLLNKKLEVTTNVYFTKNKADNNGLNSLGFPYPYVKLKDQNGNATNVPYQYRQGYIDTAGHGNLLNWNYRPLDELALNDNSATLTEYRINAAVRYSFFKGLNASVQYQYDQGNSDQKSFYDAQSYYTRNYINQFTQYDPSSNTYTRPVPTGSILDQAYQSSISQNIRAQTNYEHEWNNGNSLSALAGIEVRDITTNYTSNRIYGYDDLGSSAAIDYKTTYLLMPTYSVSNISSNLSHLGTTNRFVSYFTNIAYTLKGRYVFSGSARKDEANIFGVNTNQKGIPLWSLGASWDLNKEKFYHLNWLPYLRLRVTNGYQGNVDNSLSSLVTATIDPQTINNYQQPYSTLSNPPNPQLKWEKVNITNFGADFAFSHVLSGSLEYYIKRGTDLIGTSLVDPTTGVSTFTGNSADMTGRGIDIILNTINVNGVFKWNTSFLLSHSTDKVTKYLLKPSSVDNALSSSINPIVGNPLYSLYGFEWGGLDATGDPQVYLDGKLSKDYSGIYNSTNLANLKYQGTTNPTTFGSIRNDFSWKQLTLSVNITYKFGYYFRRPSINYSRLFAGDANFSDKDFEGRWQKVGDETKTNVPSLTYPGNDLRDQVYYFSSVLVDKGDHVRLQDISISYDINKQQFTKLPFSNIRVYAYINNIGILWRANKDGVDPDYVPNGNAIYPNPRTFALGLKASF
ncbi:SusC/RagA family TonB-linked outer membrane protein [Mucilaginibacter sp. UYCu711]|uniref:SusC/RagA family TonB-linked outer membrane protein n=1 Tax=Mucilaginibacter sp. UYCu711 TaxID=3156339 RepID=UPI003D1FAA59